VSVEARSQDEVGRLGSVFNTMVMRLKDANKKIRREVELAPSIQLGMLPKKLLELPGYDFDVSLQMAREAGGDLYNIIPLDENHNFFLVVIGDVSGKGQPAALYMSSAMNILRTQAEFIRKFDEAATLQPSEVLKRMNTLLKPNMRSGIFITMFVGVLDVQNDTFQFCSAGHDPCVQWTPATQEMTFLKTVGEACGL
jgi:phosphoserine phosphatase RsbU/P